MPALPVGEVNRDMHKRVIVLLFFAVIAIAAMLAACSSSSKGAEVFRREKCMDCHTLKGKGGAVGPNLTYVGSRRSRDYIIQQIQDPKSHNPKTEMPSFRDRLTDQELRDLAEYLSRLK